jgi:uncharacterized protein
MTTIYVDADACPVKAEVVRVAERHGTPVAMVSNQGVRPGGHPLVRNVMVGQGFDAADDWIVEHAGGGDLVVTSDIALARRALANGAAALGPTGKPFTSANIGMAMAMRDVMADLRAGVAGIGGGPAAFSKADRSNFLNALDAAVRKLGR